jgi:diaminohydroxyphosphoribosylaminopyrimidine deaminase / 5-amino-6-(5-phosphoribosylamino)uracil reductase
MAEPGAPATTGDDARFMQLALALAERGRGRVEPNPLVGAVVVREGQVIGEGWHREYGQPHAEVDALRSTPDPQGSTVYVTLEPCAHVGKTPPCTSPLIEAGVARVVYAVRDPNPHARGGDEVLREAGLDVLGGVEEQPARDLNARFFHGFAPEAAERPWIELKLAVSLDARIADSAGRSRWITGPAARGEVHRIRAAHDAIAVGIGTALADDPELTVRGEVVPRRPPVRVVFDRMLRLPRHSALARSAPDTPLWVICGEEAPLQARSDLEATGVIVIAVADLDAGLRQLRDRGVASLLCEGGGGLSGAFLNRDVVDRLSLFFAPILLGPAGRTAFGEVSNSEIETVLRWRHLRTEAFGPDTLITLARS